MSEYLQDEGLFLAKITNYGFQDSRQSESIAIRCELEVLGLIEEDELNESFAGMVTSGSFWIVGRDGDLLVDQLETLRSVGWSGDLADIQSEKWTPPVVKILVRDEEYKGKSYFKAVAIYPEDWEGGNGFSGERKTSEIVGRYASQIKALLGGSSPSPKKAQPDADDGVASEVDDDIPF